MSTISNAANAFKINGGALGRRVLSVGLVQRDNPENPGKKKTAAVAHAEIVQYATEQGIVLDRFSLPTASNAATSFDLYVATTLPIPTSSETRDAVPVAIAGMIEQARSKHGKAKVAATVKLAVADFTEYTSNEEKSAKVSEYLTALIELDAAPGESKTQSPEQRFLSALRAADTLALEVALDDEQVAEAFRLIESIRTTASDWE